MPFSFTQPELLSPIPPLDLDHASNIPSWDTSAPVLNCWDKELDGFELNLSFSDNQFATAERQSIIPIVPSAQNSQSEERGIELMMQFLGEDFPQQHPSYQHTSMKSRAWLMYILNRSSTFFYASVGMSAYLNFLKAPESARLRMDSFHEYHQFRDLAINRHRRPFQEDRRDSQPSPDPLVGEAIICGVQLAILELLAENAQESGLHLNSASLALASYWQDVSVMDQGHLSTPQIHQTWNSQQLGIPASSRLEQKALEFFSSVLIWIHIMDCTTRKVIPTSQDLYRRLLSDESPLKSFKDVVGYEGWVLVALMDATTVSIWKLEQEAERRLSIRELIIKTTVIESFLNQRIQQQGDVQTRIFAYAVVIHTHTITSGCFPAVPEIQQALDEVIVLWQALSPSLDLLKSLSWAFCVTASLASGTQRAVFQKIISDMVSIEPPSRAVLSLKAVIEECWKTFDGGSPSCNWETVMQKLGHSIPSIIFA
ncbi:hypothetical protein N7527_002123 [Penicillium freii]|nr:hypothetical protein N7527_002123 [Penicillium freii]